MFETYVLSMAFITDQGKIYALRLTDADPMVTAPEISGAMTAVIDSNVIIHKNGELAAIHSAKLIRTETETIDVA